MATSPPAAGQADTKEDGDDDVQMESVEPNTDTVEMKSDTVDAGDKGANAQEDASDDDPVVQEYDVYLNRMFDPPFGGDMYVLQYPLRPYYRPYEDQGTLERVELKPQSRRLQYVYKLHENDNYDRNDISAERMKNHVLTSTVVANPACSYAVGIIHNGRMVVAPIHAVNQLRPDFEHMDKAEENRQKFQATMDPEGRVGSAGEEDGPQSQASAVTVNYVAKKARVGGAVEGAPVEIQEDWEKLESYTRKHEETQDIHSNYFLSPAEDVGGKVRENDRRLQKLSLDDNRTNFLASTCMQDGVRTRANAVGSTRKPVSLPVGDLNDLPEDKQVEEVVRCFGGICSYSQELRHLLPLRTWRRYAHDSLILMLKECAMLVCGKWVLKSELSGFDGIACIARDMLLNLLNTKNGVLPVTFFEKWKQTFGTAGRGGQTLLPVELDAISRPLIEKVAQDAFALKYGVDEGFIKEFPDVVADFKVRWDDLRKTLPELLQRERSRPKAHSAGGNLRSQQLSVANDDDRKRRRLLVKEIHHALKQKGMTVAQLRKSVQPKFKVHRIEEREIEDILRTRDVKAIQVRHLWVAERVWNVLHDKFRTTVHDVFRQRDSATKQDIVEAFEEAENSPCALTDFCARYYIREVADRASETEDTWVLRERELV